MAPKLPIRLHEVVYTLSPFEQSVMSGVWKDFSYKFTKQIREVGDDICAKVPLFVEHEHTSLYCVVIGTAASAVRVK